MFDELGNDFRVSIRLKLEALLDEELLHILVVSDDACGGKGDDGQR